MPDVSAIVAPRALPFARKEEATDMVRKSSSRPSANASTTPRPCPSAKPVPMIAPSSSVSMAAAAARPHGSLRRWRLDSSILSVAHLTPTMASPPRAKPARTSSGAAPVCSISGATWSETAAITTPAVKCWM